MAIIYGTHSVVPTSGVWAKNDITYNSNVSAGGYIGWVCTTAGTANGTTWAATTAYAVEQMINANGKVYKCSVAGTSGSTAPSHTSGSAVDGSVTWDYVGVLAVLKGFGAIQA